MRQIPIHPNVYGASGISTGTFAAQADPGSMWATLGSYAPTPVECLVALGVISVGVLVFMVLSNKLVAGDAKGVAEETPRLATESE